MFPFSTIKTMVVPCTTSPSAAIAIPVPAGSQDLKGLGVRLWTDTGQVIAKFGGNAVAADKTLTGNALADGNIPATNTFENLQYLPSSAAYVSAVAQSGTPNLYLEFGMISGD